MQKTYTAKNKLNMITLQCVPWSDETLSIQPSFYAKLADTSKFKLGENVATINYFN